MAARRLILAMLFLLVLSSIIVALIPIEQPEQNEDSSTTSTTTTSTVSDEGKLIVRGVSTDAPKPAKIRMHVGDELRLTVTSPVANQVEIEALGEYENVDPNFPARFDVFPFDAGRFPVRLLDPPGQVATIVVEP
jgi:hypothetical protein